MRWSRVAIVVWLAIFAVYGITTCPFVLGGDAGELATAASGGGIAHPPGYPLFTLLGRLFFWLPAESPAHRIALVTAMTGTLAVASLSWAARRWGASRGASLAVAVLFAFGPLAWSLSIHAEVFALNVLISMLIVGMSSHAPFGKGRRGELVRAGLLGLLAGLALSNHHSAIFLAPVGVFAVVRATKISGASAVGLAVIGLLVGLTPYLWLMKAARGMDVGSACVWGDPRDLAGVLRQFFRVDYGMTQLAANGSAREPGAQLAAFGRRALVDLLGAPIVIIVAAIVSTSRPRSRSWSRPRMLGLALLGTSFLLVGPIFLATFNIPPRGLGSEVVARFHLLPIAMLAIFVALAFDVLTSALGRFGGHRRLRTLGGPALVVVAVVLRVGLSIPDIREQTRPTLQNYLANVFLTLPPNAIVVGSGDDRTGAFAYARCALHERLDVAFVAPRLLVTPWYPRELSAQLGFDVPHATIENGRPKVHLPELFGALRASGRPLYATDGLGGDIAALGPSYPVGPLVRLPSHPSEMPSPSALADVNDDLFVRFMFEPTLPSATSWSGRRMLDYARTWWTLASALDPIDPARAEACRRRADAFTPR